MPRTNLYHIEPYLLIIFHLKLRPYFEEFLLPGQNSKKRCKENDQVSKIFKSDGQPTTADKRRIVKDLKIKSIKYFTQILIQQIDKQFSSMFLPDLSFRI
jgi:hypothetical protein